MATSHLAKELAVLGHQVHVLTSGKIGEQSVDRCNGFTIYRSLSLRKGVHDCGFRGAATFTGFAWPKLRALIRNNHYDIFHYFFSLPTGFLTRLPGVRHRRPYIISLRGSDVPGYDLFNRKLTLLHGLLKPITKKIWKRSKAVVAVTNSLRRLALETTPELPIEVIPNGVDSDLFKPLKIINEDRSRFKLICVSRLVERKGIEDILEAMAGLKSDNVKLSIVGSGKSENGLRRRCSELSLNSMVEFKGFCQWEKLPALYASNDAFILTSRSEAFGNVFAEAMSCGLPVIGADVGGIPDLISEKNGLLVKPGDIESIKQAILKLKSSRQLCAQMGKASREIVERNYRWPQIAKKYLEIYES